MARLVKLATTEDIINLDNIAFLDCNYEVPDSKKFIVAVFFIGIQEPKLYFGDSASEVYQCLEQELKPRIDIEKVKQFYQAKKQAHDDDRRAD